MLAAVQLSIPKMTANGGVSSPLAARSQMQRRKPSLSPAPASIATGKTLKARKRRSATPKKSSRSSKSTNAQATSQAAKKQKAKKKSIKPAPKKSKVAVAVQSTAVEPIAMCCCGSADGNDEMVCCDGCDSWLHRVCNGWDGPLRLQLSLVLLTRTGTPHPKVSPKNSSAWPAERNNHCAGLLIRRREQRWTTSSTLCLCFGERKERFAFAGPSS